MGAPCPSRSPHRPQASFGRWQHPRSAPSPPAWHGQKCLCVPGTSLVWSPSAVKSQGPGWHAPPPQAGMPTPSWHSPAWHKRAPTQAGMAPSGRQNPSAQAGTPQKTGTAPPQLTESSCFNMGLPKPGTAPPAGIPAWHSPLHQDHPPLGPQPVTAPLEQEHSPLALGTPSQDPSLDQPPPHPSPHLSFLPPSAILVLLSCPAFCTSCEDRISAAPAAPPPPPLPVPPDPRGNSQWAAWGCRVGARSGPGRAGGLLPGPPGCGGRGSGRGLPAVGGEHGGAQPRPSVVPPHTLPSAPHYPSMP